MSILSKEIMQLTLTVHRNTKGKNSNIKYNGIT